MVDSKRKRRNEPKHKVREKTNKTIIDKLKESALFILLLIAIIITWVVSLIFWISSFLGQSDPDQSTLDAVLTPSFYVFVGLGIFLAAFFGTATIIQRRAHGS